MTIVVKVGSNIIAGETGLDETRIQSIAADVSGLMTMGHHVVLVSSGAIAAGMAKLRLKKKPKDIRVKQASAAVGQSSLMWAYERSFKKYKRLVAQLLLTRDGVSDRVRYMNSKNTILTLLQFGVVPIINENDTVATDEIKFGDNDQLAALVASLIGAERLIILSDVEGLYDADPKKKKSAKLIERVEEISPDIKALAGDTGSMVGTGGMFSKVMAAEIAVRSGISVNIVSGKEPYAIVKIIRGHKLGTEFVTKKEPFSARKGWIAFGIRSKGELVLDDGAAKALADGGKSLLPSGVVRASGTFGIGDAVHCIDIRGNRIAKGLTNYSSDELNKIKGLKSTEIEKVLGYKYSDEIIHRDDMVVLTNQKGMHTA